MCLAHVTPEGAPVDLQPEFEQFTADAPGTPAAILHRHALDQGDRVLVKPRLATGSLGFMPPEEFEPAPVPFKQRVRLDNQQHLFPARQTAGQHDQQTAVQRREGWVFHLPF